MDQEMDEHSVAKSMASAGNGSVMSYTGSVLSRSGNSGVLRRARGGAKASTASRSRYSRFSSLTGNKAVKGISSENSAAGTFTSGKTLPTYAMESLSGASAPGTKILNDDYYKAMEAKLRHEEVLSTKLHHPNTNSISFNTGKVGQLPWVDNDNETLREQVAFWKNCLVEGDESMPNEGIKDLLKTLYTVLRTENISRSDRALEAVSEKLSKLQRLDLQKLVQLMTEHQRAGEAMEGKDVILLTGTVGSGKTTTLHFLAGTLFEETEVDGFIHLEPKKLRDPSLKEYKTTCGRDAMTRKLQTAAVTYKDEDEGYKPVVICDTPGFGLETTPEEELAFYYGMRSALDNAKRVKPVVVLNADLMGSCFSHLPDTLQMLQQDLSLKTPRDLKPLDYVFINYEEKHRTRLCQQFTSLKKNKPPSPEKGGRDLYEDFVNDMILKTTPNAKLVMPLEDDPEELLDGLWKEAFVNETREYYYRTPASETALKLLQLQLQITVEELRVALSREVYSLALNRLVLLDKLSQWFPQAKQAALMAQEAASRQVTMIWEWMKEEISNANYDRALFRMEQMSDFGLIFPDAHVCFKNGHDLIWESLVSPMEEKDYAIAVERISKLSKLTGQYTEANHCVKRALKVLRKKTDSILDMGGYEEAISMLAPLKDLEDIPDAVDCASQILRHLRELMELTMGKDDYSIGLRIIHELNGLKGLYPEAIDIIDRGLKLCRLALEISAVEGDYEPAWLLVQNLQRMQDFPEAEEVAQFGLEFFTGTVEDMLQQKDYKSAIGFIRNKVDSEASSEDGEELPGSTNWMSILSNEIQSLMESGDYSSATILTKQIVADMPGSDEFLANELKVFGKEVESLVQSKKYNKAVFLMKELATEIPGTSEYILKGLLELKGGLREAIKDGDFETALDVIYEVNTLAKIVPQADACIEYAFNSLEENILIAIDRQEYKSAIHLMELLSEGDNRLPLAKECTHVGIQVLKRNVAKAIEKKKYTPALDMIQQMSGREQKIPEVGECSRRGLDLLKSTAEKAIEDKDYTTAIEIITNLSELSHLPEAKSCTLSALHAIVNHVTELRDAMEKTVEEVCQIRDLKVFVAMLLKLKAQVEKVSKSEPLRKLSVQIHYKKNFRSKEDGSGESNVLFVPQLYTSQAFCSDHLELLTGKVREKLPDFDVNDACMESLIRNRKGILSVMIRLKAANKILQNCPGGEKVSAIYESTFKQFHALVDTVLAIAEESFKPPIDLRLFELQAWFLSVLIKGFLKDKIDIGSDERREMEELENRRKVLMLQFEVQMTDALEILSDQEFLNDLVEDSSDSGSEEGTPALDLTPAEGETAAAAIVVYGAEQTAEIKKVENPVTSEAIEMLDFSIFETPRHVLISLCQRPELFKMILKQMTPEQVETTIKAFDWSLVKYLGQMVRYGDSEYNSLIEFAKSGAGLPAILEKVNAVKALVDKIEQHLGVPRSWGAKFITDTSLHQQKLLILKKRIELATEKLETTIKTEKDIGFGTFVANVAKAPFFCNGRWYDDIPTSFL